MSSVITLAVVSLLIILSLIAFPEIKIFKLTIPTYILVSLAGAIFLIVSKSISIEGLLEPFDFSYKMNPAKILILFISMTVLSIFLDELGLFRYLANKLVDKLHNNQYVLFFGFYVFLSILTIFTSNDIIILTFTPFICYYTKRANINPLPYIVSEFVASNTWSMALIVGNPTNIYLASSYGIDFISYMINMFLPTLAASIVSLGIMLILFKKQLDQKMEISDNEHKNINKALTIIGLIHLIGCVVLVAVSNYLNLEMWFITTVFCVSLLFIYFVYRRIKKGHHTYIKNTIKRCPWGLIPFVLSMFVIVLSLKEQGVLIKFKELLGDNVFSYGFSGALVANLMNNIPMSVLYSQLLNGVSIKSVYASIIASNIAAFISPFGALAGIMWMKLLKKFEIKFSFGQFFIYGLIVGLPTLSIALLVLYFI